VEPVVLVDANNVRRSLWPNIPEDELVELVRAWAEQEGVRAVVVFDGQAPGGLRGSEQLDSRTTLVGTGDESADDWIAGEAPRLERYRLVTSDRELRRRAGGGAEQIVGGGSFARTLRAC
jgi:predicted RNA-binding protein with PIN domain